MWLQVEDVISQFPELLHKSLMSPRSKLDKRDVLRFLRSTQDDGVFDSVGECAPSGDWFAVWVSCVSGVSAVCCECCMCFERSAVCCECCECGVL